VSIPLLVVPKESAPKLEQLEKSNEETLGKYFNKGLLSEA